MRMNTKTMMIMTMTMYITIINTLKFGASLYCLTYIGYHAYDDDDDDDD